MPTNEQLIGAAYCALNAYNFAEFIQEYTMLFGATKTEVDNVITYANIIKTLDSLGYEQFKYHELILVFNCLSAMNKGKNNGSRN
jgi:hypothetical protein